MTEKVTRRPPAVARITIGAALIALIALAVLHILRPDLDPMASMISQYAIGESGWLMGLSFAGFAAASLGLLIALFPVARGFAGMFGLLALLAATVGLVFGGAFPMDETTTDPALMSFSGQMHGVGFMVGVPGELLAVLLLTIALKSKPEWAKLPLIALAAIVWLSLIVMAADLTGLTKSFGLPGMTIFGWPNRIFMAAYAVWIIAAALPLAKAR